MEAREATKDTRTHMNTREHMPWHVEKHTHRTVCMYTPLATGSISMVSMTRSTGHGSELVFRSEPGPELRISARQGPEVFAYMHVSVYITLLPGVGVFSNRPWRMDPDLGEAGASHCFPSSVWTHTLF